MIFRHIDDVSVSTIFSDCNKYRYKLTVENNCKNGDQTVCVIMQNPSVANSKIADRSAQFLEKLIFQKGYDEFKDVKTLIIVNQFAYVKTNDFVDSEDNIGPDNDLHIRDAVKGSDMVLIAWGASNGYDKRKKNINSIVSQYTDKILYQTKAHPSRGTYTNFVEPYRI